MTSIINLEDLPQLIMDKIISLLNHKQLIALEQVSRKLKLAVDSHFAISDHFIIGPLPKVSSFNDYDEASTRAKKYLDGLLKIIMRCGIRLRTIQITTTYEFTLGHIENYKTYIKYFFASDHFSYYCPNVENIIVSPYMDIISIADHVYGNTFVQQKVLVNEQHAEIYANNVLISTGKRCKLRSICLSFKRVLEQEESYRRILNLYSNIEQMYVLYLSDYFYKYLPQLMKNGLKDLNIGSSGLSVDYRIAKKCCNIWKDLRTLRLVLPVRNDDDISAINELQLPKNVELKIVIHNVDDCFAQLNESVCNSVINCDIYGSTDYSLMSKLKNLKGFDITNSVLAKESFPKLRRLTISYDLCNGKCDIAHTCDSHTFLLQVLINKGNQLTIIHIDYVCQKSVHVIWKALKHCKAAKNIELHRVDVDSYLTVTYENMEAIYNLPNLQHFVFFIFEGVKHETCSLLRELMERAVKQHTDLEFEYKLAFIDFFTQHKYSLYRINF